MDFKQVYPDRMAITKSCFWGKRDELENPEKNLRIKQKN